MYYLMCDSEALKLKSGNIKQKNLLEMQDMTKEVMMRKNATDMGEKGKVKILLSRSLE